jgi:hypothetical protein
MLELPNPFAPDHTVVRLLEPADADRTALAERLRDGTYDKPFLAEDGRTRALHFCWTYVQSRMRLDDPVALQMTYTRMMMSFLLFHTTPRAIAILGLGGGSLAKYCHRNLPEARIVAVECNRDVLAMRGEFAVPPDDARFTVVGPTPPLGSPRPRRDSTSCCSTLSTARAARRGSRTTASMPASATASGRTACWSRTSPDAPPSAPPI